MDGYGKSGFFILLRWLIGFFLPQLQGFLPVNYKFSPCDGVVCVGQVGSVSDVNQRIIIIYNKGTAGVPHGRTIDTENKNLSFRALFLLEEQQNIIEIDKRARVSFVFL